MTLSRHSGRLASRSPGFVPPLLFVAAELDGIFAKIADQVTT